MDVGGRQPASPGHEMVNVPVSRKLPQQTDSATPDLQASPPQVPAELDDHLLTS
jgi:hypothetical protein